MVGPVEVVSARRNLETCGGGGKPGCCVPGPVLRGDGGTIPQRSCQASSLVEA